MSVLLRTKQVKTGNENRGGNARLTSNDVFINLLDNYQNANQHNHVQSLQTLFVGNAPNGTTETLQSALFLTFLYSQEILDQYVPKEAKCIVVADCQKETLSTTMEVTNGQPNLKIVYPRRTFGGNTPASFHPKLFILKFKSFIRIVIGSANLLNCDWYRYANIFWRKDFPLAQGLKCESGTSGSQFTNYLSQFISRSMDPFGNEVDSFLGIRFRNYLIEDPPVHLVASLPGSHSHNDNFAVSLNQISAVLKSHPPSRSFKLETTRIYYITSSLGCVSFKLLFDFAKSIFTDVWFTWDYAVKHRDQVLSLFNVIYPSKNYISGTYFGESRANCLFLRGMIYDSFKFEKSVMRSFEGNLKVRGNNSVLPHYKVWIVTHDGKFDSDTIVYLGSHNFTQSAWGKMRHREDKLEVCNYELGVLFPPKENSFLMKEVLVDQLGVVLPPPGYAQHDRPFFVNDES